MQIKPISIISDTNALEQTINGTEGRMSNVKKPKWAVTEQQNSIQFMIVSYSIYGVLISAVDKSTTEMPLVFFNNCFEDKTFNDGN